MGVSNSLQAESGETAEVSTKVITVVDVNRSRGRVEYRGTCGPDVTVQDIKKQFYDPYLGGTGAYVSNGKWAATEYTD